MALEPSSLPARSQRKARQPQPQPRRRPPSVRPLLWLLVLLALVAAFSLYPGLLPAGAALNPQYLGLAVAGLLGLLLLTRAARSHRGRARPARELTLPAKPVRRPDPLPAAFPGEEPPPEAGVLREKMAPGPGEQILFALIVIIFTGLITGSVLYLELLWYFNDAPYRFFGFAGLGGVALLIVMLSAVRSRRPAGPRPPRTKRQPAAAAEVAAAREPAPGRPPRVEKEAGRARVREADWLDEPEPAPAEPVLPPVEPAKAETPRPKPGRPPAKAQAPAPFWRAGHIGVGLDIGTAQIKLVQVRGTRKGPVVTSFGIAPTPRQAIVEGVVTKPQEVADAIRILMAEVGISHRKVVTLVGGQGVILRHAEFPRMTEQELRDLLRWEAEQYIPIPPEESISDFTILGNGPASDGKGQAKMKVLLVGTQRKIVQSVLDTLRVASLYPMAIDVDALAHFRVLTANGYCTAQPRNVSHMVVDIGAAATKLSVFQAGVPHLSRTIAVAGNGMTAAVAQGLGEDMASAERTKRELGALPDTPIAPYLQPLLDELLLEIRRSLEFYLVRNYGEDIKCIYLAGGGAMLKGLPEALADYLNVSMTERAEGDPDLTVVPVEPLREVEIHPSLAEQRAYFGPQFAGALGLALREGG